MKPLLIAALLSYSFVLHSQSFIITPSGLVNGADPAKTYVVIKVDSVSAKDLYSRSYSYIQHSYKNPEIANNGKVDNEFLHVNTYAPAVSSFKAGFQKIYVNLKYSLNLDFKDGKVKYEISDLDMHYNGTNGQEYPFLLERNGLTWSIYNKDGSKLKQDQVKADIEAYFNAKIMELMKALKTDTKSDF